MRPQLDVTDYREWLKGEFARRKEKNPSYSLRAYARDLGLQPPRLSEVLKGKEGISEKTGRRIADRLKLKAKSKKYWLSLVQSQSGRSQLTRLQGQKNLEAIWEAKKYSAISEDEFHFVSDWYHGAILELTQVNDFKPDEKWISEALGLPLSTVEAALQRLENLKILKRTKKGKWLVKPEGFMVGGEVPSSAVRKYHRQLIEKGLVSLLNDPMEKREINSMIVAIPSQRMDEFRQAMGQFIEQFWDRIKDDEKDDLYGLSLQLFPVRKDRK